MKKLLSILLACGLLCALAACSGNGKVSISIEEETGSIPPSVAPQNTETPEQTQPEATTLELDTLYEIPDYAELTLVRITTTSEVWASMGGTLYYENKKDGEIYIDAVFDVVNTSSETIECDELLTATAVGSNGAEYDSVLYCGEKNDMTSVSSNLDIPPLSSCRVHAAISVPETESEFTLNYDVNGTLFTCQYNASTEMKSTTPLKAGDVIQNPDYADMTFVGYEFTDAVYPSNTNGYYRYYKVDSSDNTYLALTFQVTNYQSTAKDIDTFISGRSTFMDKYQYTGFVVSEDTDGAGLSNYNDIQPLATAKVICLIEVPKSIAEENFTVSVMFDKQEYTVSSGS